MASEQFFWQQFFDFQEFSHGKFKETEPIQSCQTNGRSATVYACKTWTPPNLKTRWSLASRKTHDEDQEEDEEQEQEEEDFGDMMAPLFGDNDSASEPEARQVVLKMFGPSQSAIFETEKFVLDELSSHENVVGYDGVVVDDNSGCRGLVLEYAAGGDLLSYLRANGAMPEAKAALLFSQVVLALLWAHQHDICHRDAKPDNVLFVDAERTHVVLTDWGLATRFVPGKRLLRRACGSLLFCAPEILHHQSYEGPEVDAYSAGQLLYSMVTGEIMFVGDNPNEVLDDMSTHVPKYPRGVSPELRSLIAGLVAERANRRLSLEDVVFHPWLKMFGIDLRHQTGASQCVEGSLSLGVVSHQISSSSASTSLSAVLAGFVPPDHLYRGRRSRCRSDTNTMSNDQRAHPSSSSSSHSCNHAHGFSSSSSSSSSSASPSLSPSRTQSPRSAAIELAESLDSLLSVGQPLPHGRQQDYNDPYIERSLSLLWQSNGAKVFRSV